MKKTGFLLFIVVWVACQPTSECLGAAPDKGKITFTEKVIPFGASVGTGWEIFPASVTVSSDVKRIAYVVHKGDKSSRVVVDGKPGPEFAGIKAGTPQFSPDARRLVYGACDINKAWKMVENGTGGRPFDNISQPIFSYDSKRLAYVAQDKDRLCVVLDGKEGPFYKGISKTGLPKFSPDSRHLCYVAMDNEKMSLVVDQVKSYEADFIAFPTYSLDSTQLASIAARGGKWYLMVNGTPRYGTPYEGIDFIAFSPDSKRIVHTAKIKDKNYFVVDGKQEGPYDYVTFPVFFSPDSKILAYVATEKKNMLLIVNGKVQEKTKGTILNMVFSADSRRFAYTLKEKGKYYVVIDGVRSNAYDNVRPLVMSGNSRNYAYIANKGKKDVCIINGKEGPAYDQIPIVIFGGDSDRHAYLVQDGDTGRVVVDGKPGPAYKLVTSPAFSPDSSHFAYLAVKEIDGKNKCVLVVDNQEGKNVFPGFVAAAGIIFDSPSSLHTIVAGPDNQFMRLDVDID